MKLEKDLKNQVFSFRISKSEANKLKMAAKRKKIPVAEYVRELVTSK